MITLCSTTCHVSSPTAPARKTAKAQGGIDAWYVSSHRQDERVEGEEEGDVEHEVEPFLGTLELENVAEDAKRVVVGDAEDVDLRELDHVLNDVDALDQHDGEKERGKDTIKQFGHDLVLTPRRGPPGFGRAVSRITRPQAEHRARALQASWAFSPSSAAVLVEHI